LAANGAGVSLPQGVQ